MSARQPRTLPPIVVIEDHGTIVMIRPQTDNARRWLDEHVAFEAWQWVGGALAIEPRCAEAIAVAMAEALL